ncbi:hypothetical protein NA56DRAFT_657497 [Hyaloscypha hepaticicola]|uniref:Uncharacterized protein n=1 Tax=Hyaloscypha hepaticicola TaxID=2082293 RepID=A0A2J6QB25_9HELO|nr:hypothetical protein NA56DRAFT_657497 [Hyaloscypha hepaticicola]
MASSHNSNTPEFRRKDAARTVSPPTIKQDEGTADNIRGIRLLFWPLFVCQIFYTYRAYEIYQNFDSWVSLNRKDKKFLAWGVVSTVVMAFFTAGYAVVEYQRRQIGKKDKSLLPTNFKPSTVYQF